MQQTIFFDLDGTLTPQSTWYVFNLRLGITPDEDKNLFEKYLKETLSYREWNRALVELYRSRTAVSREDIVALANDIELRDDAKNVISTLKERGYDIVLLSGSVDSVVEQIAKRLDIQEWYATSRLVFDEKNQLVDIIASGDEAPAKEKLAETYCTKKTISMTHTYSVEDGGNGLELFKRTKGILLGDNALLKPFAWKQVATLSEILDIL